MPPSPAPTPKWQLYLMVAGGGGAILGAYSLMIDKERYNYDNMPICVQFGIDMMRAKKGALEQLGEPYTLKRPKLHELTAEAPAQRVKVVLPVIGKNDSAELIVHADKPNPQTRFTVSLVEMTFKSIANMKAILWTKKTTKDAETPTSVTS